MFSTLVPKSPKETDRPWFTKQSPLHGEFLTSRTGNHRKCRLFSSAFSTAKDTFADVCVRQTYTRKTSDFALNHANEVISPCTIRWRVILLASEVFS